MLPREESTPTAKSHPVEKSVNQKQEASRVRRFALKDPNILYSLLTQITNKAPGLVAAMILTRIFSMDEMGGFFFASAYVYFFSILVAFGTNIHLVRSVASNPEHGLDRLGEVLALRLPLTLAAFIVLNCFALVFASDLFLVVLLTSLHILLGDLSHSFGAYLCGRQQFRLRFLLALTGPAFLVSGVVLAVYLGANLVQILSVYVAASVVMLTVHMLAVNRYYGCISLPRGGEALWKVMLLCWPILLLDALQIVQFKIDTLMLYLLASTEAVAQYETAYRLLEVTRLTVRPLAVVAFPVCVALATRNQWQDINRLILKVVAVAAALGCVLSLVVHAAPNSIMALIWGEDYRGAGDVLQILFLTAPLLLVGVVCAGLATAIHLERHLILVMLGATVLNLSLNVWAIPNWGADGAAWATLTTEAFIVLGLAFIWHRTLSAHINQSTIKT